MEKKSQQTLSLEDSLAKTCPSPASKQESKAPVQDYGRNSIELLAKYDLGTRLWKTSQHSLVATGEDGLAEFSETWPRSGMTVNGIAYQLPPLVPLIVETGYGLWPTPCSAAEAPNLNSNKKNGPKSLIQVAREMWPTPTAHNAKEGGYPAEYSRNTPTLAAEAGGKLNPTWVEWLMGFSPGWTDLKDSETPSSHKSLK